MSVVRVFRQFHEGDAAVTLTKVLVLPDVPTMGARLEPAVLGTKDDMMKFEGEMDSLDR